MCQSRCRDTSVLNQKVCWPHCWIGINPGAWETPQMMPQISWAIHSSETLTGRRWEADKSRHPIAQSSLRRTTLETSIKCLPTRNPLRHPSRQCQIRLRRRLSSKTSRMTRRAWRAWRQTQLSKLQISPIWPPMLKLSRPMLQRNLRISEWGSRHQIALQLKILKSLCNSRWSNLSDRKAQSYVLSNTL